MDIEKNVIRIVFVGGIVIAIAILWVFFAVTTMSSSWSTKLSPDLLSLGEKSEDTDSGRMGRV